MSERIEIEFTPCEGSVLRLIGTVERRGYEVRAMTMTSGEGGASLALDVRGRDDTRRLDVVAGHLRRLVDVRSVSHSNLVAGSSQ